MSTAETLISTNDEQLKEAILNLISNIQKDPKQADATFRAKSKLENGFLTDVNIRNFEFVSDEPAELGGTDKGPNPVEYVLGAFAACQEIVIKAYATVLDIDLKSVNVEVEGDLNLHGFLNLSDARAGFETVSYKTTIETNETDTEKLKTLEKLSVTRCPVLDIIKNPVELNGSVHFTPY
ncbi:MAG: OsmC family protein [Balneolaceae bacterium]|nr:OsmC family protein [Balneolaceae bacterium]